MYNILRGELEMEREGIADCDALKKFPFLFSLVFKYH